jgi:hypothetical protein
MAPYPFFKSITHDLITGPPFYVIISKLKTPYTLGIKSFPSPLSKKVFINAKIFSAFN